MAGRRPPRRRHPAPLPHAATRLSPRRQLPRLHGRDRRRARACRLVHPPAGRRYGRARRHRPSPRRARDGDGAPPCRPARRRPRPRFRIPAPGRGGGGERKPLSRPRRARGRPQPSGDGGQSRRLYPLHPLRARLSRGPGQRCDRHGGARGAGAHRVRHGRCDGRFELRRLRRMRAGVPHRRVAPRRRRGAGSRPHGEQPVPLLRRRLPARLACEGRPHPARRRARRPRQPRAAVRQGPLRVRLCPPPEPADRAADPQAGSRQAAGRHGRPRRPVEPLPGGRMGRSARRRGARFPAYPRGAWRRRSRRFRLRQGVQRRSLAGSETGAHRLSHQQCRPLHAPVPREFDRRLAGEHRFGRRHGAGLRGRQRRCHPGGGGQPRREPPRRRHLHEERGQARRETDRRGPPAAWR